MEPSNPSGNSPSTPATSERPSRPFCVVAAVDMTAASFRVIRRALRIANATPGSLVHAVFVNDPPALGLGPEIVGPAGATGNPLQNLTEMADTEAKALAGAVGPLQIGKVVVHLLSGSPAGEIVWLAAHLEADLVVVGTHGRTGIKRALLGSVAERVVRSAGCPVLVERATSHDPSAHDAEILPLCPACKERRQATAGKELWCEKHREHHVHGHVYSGPQMETGAASSPFAWS